MPLTFNYPVQTKPTGTTTFKRRSAEFGEGYTQFVASGALNNKKSVWNLVFDGDMAGTEAVKAFLDQHQGVTSFFWTPPNAVAPHRFVCGGYTENPDVASQNVLSFTFEEVFF